jgi:hypothetical protein
MDEAMHPLTLLVTGVYGKPLPNQNGAPLRLVVPWKYGFKGIKSIVRIRFVERQPVGSWQTQNPTEYGFYSNVNPQVDHPRWTQARERRIGEFFRRPTVMFNGYGDEASLTPAWTSILLMAGASVSSSQARGVRGRADAAGPLGHGAAFGPRPGTDRGHRTALATDRFAHHARLTPSECWRGTIRAVPADARPRAFYAVSPADLLARPVLRDRNRADIVKRPFIPPAVRFAILAIAATSTDGMIRRLGGRTWKRLHRLAYLAALAGIVHYWWLVKADISLPRAYAIAFAIVLAARLYVAWRTTMRGTTGRPAPRASISARR